MIIIELIGLDMFETRKYSLVYGESIAKEYGVSVNDIYFVANEGAIFNNGTEQGAWNVIVKILAPSKLNKIEKNVADKILATITKIVIHAHIMFEYYDDAQVYHKYNNEYPLFLETNEEDYDCEEDHECICGEGCDCGEDCDCEEDDDGDGKCCCHKHE